MRDMKGGSIRAWAVELAKFPSHLNFLAAKIDEQADIVANRGEVIDELNLMGFYELIHGFYFQDDAFVDHKSAM